MSFDSCEVDVCEVDTPLGARGTCNNITNLCECPEGFDGQDEWRIVNDCHVNADIRLYIRVVLFGLAVFGLIVSFYGIVHFSRMLESVIPSWFFSGKRSAERRKELDRREVEARRAYQPSRTFVDANFDNKGLYDLDADIEEAQVEDYTALGADNVEDQRKKKRRTFFSRPVSNLVPSAAEPRPSIKDGSPRNLNQSQAQIRRRRVVNRMALQLMMYIFSAALFISIYYGLLLNLDGTGMIGGGSRGYKYENRMRNIFMDAGVGFAVGSIQLALWKLSFMWYDSLPHNRMFASLFGFRSILVTYPQSFRLLTEVMAYLGFAMPVFFLFILPSFVDEDRRSTWDQATMIYITLNQFILAFVITFICALLLRVYNAALRTLEPQRRTEVGWKPERETNEGGAESAAAQLQERSRQVVAEADARQNRAQRMQFIRAKRLVLLSLVGNWLASPIILAMTAGATFGGFLKDSFYISFSVIVFCTILAGFTVIFIILYGTSRQMSSKEAEKRNADLDRLQKEREANPLFEESKKNQFKEENPLFKESKKNEPKEENPVS